LEQQLVVEVTQSLPPGGLAESVLAVDPEGFLFFPDSCLPDYKKSNTPHIVVIGLDHLDISKTFPHFRLVKLFFFVLVIIIIFLYFNCNSFCSFF
jgi:hypothetical protein